MSTSPTSKEKNDTESSESSNAQERQQKKDNSQEQKNTLTDEQVESFKPSNTEERQQEKKEDSQQQKNTHISDESNTQKSVSEQSPPKRELSEHPDRKTSELPQTPLQDQTGQPTSYAYSQNQNESSQSYSQNVSQPGKSNQQYSSQPGQPSQQQYSSQTRQPSQQQYTSQSRQPYQPNLAQPGQSYPQYYPQPGQAYPQYYSQVRQPNQYAPQAKQPYQQYPYQPSQYIAPPVQQQQVYYSPHQQNPQRTIVIHVSSQPESAQDSPMARPGRPSNPREPALEGWSGFQDAKVRTAFVRKVYFILMIQLLFTMGTIALFIFENHVKDFVHKNIYIYYISMAVFFAIFIGMACFQSLRRSFPSNIIALTVFTLALSVMLGTVSSFHRTDAVLIAVGICAAVCLVVSLLSFCTKFDFTSCSAVLCILVMILVMFGFIAILIPSKIMTLIYAGTGATVFTLFLAYDTQMLMGGKTIEINPEEYVFAAVQIYLDVAFIFLFILTIMTYCCD